MFDIIFLKIKFWFLFFLFKKVCSEYFKVWILKYFIWEKDKKIIKNSNVYMRKIFFYIWKILSVWKLIIVKIVYVFVRNVLKNFDVKLGL